MIINNKYNGFTLLEKKFIKDINSTAYLFNHDNTNAGLVFLENDDKNKTFSVSFKTPPQDETGLIIFWNTVFYPAQKNTR